jgi:hypothetical protein
MRVVWPVLSALLVIHWLLGMIVGHVEGWSVGDASYFTFVTGLTVGYGDLVPRQAVSRILAVLIGFIGAGPGACKATSRRARRRHLEAANECEGAGPPPA